MSDDTPDPDVDPDTDLLEVEALLRSLTVDDLSEPEAPPASVWAGIQATISGDAVAASDPDPVVSLADHRRMRSGGVGRLVLAAAAIAVVVAGAVVVATRRGDDAEVVAVASLTHDPVAFDPAGRGASATAQLVEGDDGYELVFVDSTLPAEIDEDADLELWLIDVRDDGSLDVQPVALIDSDEPGTYAVPSELDPATYSVVDISIEPRDGDAAHSGRSILRGELQA